MAETATESSISVIDERIIDPKENNKDVKMIKDILEYYNWGVQDLALTIRKTKATVYNYLSGRKIPHSTLTLLNEIHTEILEEPKKKSTIQRIQFKNKIESWSILTYFNILINAENLDQNKFIYFFTVYFEMLKKEIKLAKHSILILDYLADNRSVYRKFQGDKAYIKEAYLDLFREYLKCIEEKLISNKSIEYIRVLQAPLSSKRPYYNNIGDVLPVISDYMYEDIFKHYKLLEKHKINYALHFLGVAVQPKSVIIIDDKTRISEDLRADADKALIPDKLEIHRLVGNHNDIKVKQLIQSDHWHITNSCHSESQVLWNNWPAALKTALEIQFNKFSKDSEELKKILDKISNPKKKNRLGRYAYQFNIQLIKIKQRNLVIALLFKKLQIIDVSTKEFEERFLDLASKIDVTL